MSPKRERYFTLVLFIGFGYLVYFLYDEFLSRYHNPINLISILGTYISIFGLVVAYLQILSVKDKTNLINIAVRQEHQRVNLLLYMNEVGRGKKLIEQAQFYMRAKNIEIAHLKISEIKEILFNAQNLLELNNITINENYKNSKTQIVADLNNLNAYLFDNTSKLNLKTINTNLENISSIFIAINGNLLNLNHV